MYAIFYACLSSHTMMTRDSSISVMYPDVIVTTMYRASSQCWQVISSLFPYFLLQILIPTPFKIMIYNYCSSYVHMYVRMFLLSVVWCSLIPKIRGERLWYILRLLGMIVEHYIRIMIVRTIMIIKL